MAAGPDTKFGKSRLVPIHTSTLAAIQRFQRLRDRTFPSPKTTAVFVAGRGTRIAAYGLDRPLSEPIDSIRRHVVRNNQPTRIALRPGGPAVEALKPDAWTNVVIAETHRLWSGTSAVTNVVMRRPTRSGTSAVLK